MDANQKTTTAFQALEMLGYYFSQTMGIWVACDGSKPESSNTPSSEDVGLDVAMARARVAGKLQPGLVWFRRGDGSWTYAGEDGPAACSHGRSISVQDVGAGPFRCLSCGQHFKRYDERVDGERLKDEKDPPMWTGQSWMESADRSDKLKSTGR